MPDLGKVDRAFFEEHIYPNLGADREDVTLGPQHGVDFGVVDVGGRALVLATDPVFVMPALGFERAAWFAFHVVLSDVAVSGLAPTHLSVDLNLPPEMTDAEFRTVWETFDREARDFGVAVATGHTARYAGCNYPMVGGATAIAVGDHDDVVRPDGARPGDRLVVTKGPAIEATALLAIQFEALAREGVAPADGPDDGVAGEDRSGGDGDDGPTAGDGLAHEPMADADLAAATERFYDMSPVRDALTAAAAGPVHAMHDATEGGVTGGLVEMARAAGVRFEVERDRIPVAPGVEAACEFFGIDPWSAISEGTLLASVAPEGVDDVLAALADEGIAAADVGEVTEGEGVVVDGERVEPPERDPFWGAFERFAAIAGAGE